MDALPSNAERLLLGALHNRPPDSGPQFLVLLFLLPHASLFDAAVGHVVEGEGRIDGNKRSAGLEVRPCGEKRIFIVPVQRDLLEPLPFAGGVGRGGVLAGGLWEVGQGW